MPLRIQDILIPTAAFSPQTRLSAVLQHFVSAPELVAVPVVMDVVPVGIVSRVGVMELVNGAAHRLQLLRQPVSSVLNNAPALAEVTAPAAYIAKKFSEERPEALADGVIALQEGRYAGYVPPLAFFKAVANENADRARAMRQSARKLDETRERAAEARREQARFLAFLGHEIRTPLTGILGVADLLSDQKLTPAARDYARTIAASGTHLDRLLADLLDLSRLEVGKLAVAPAPFKLTEFANEARKLWSAQSQKGAVNLKVTVDDRAADRVEGDATRLRQILFNLIGNAIKFTENGTVSAHIATRLWPNEGLKLEITVTDTGTGISDTDKARLFEAFEQATPQTVHRYGGTGLGLSIAKGLIERMGGKITLTDNPEGGTIFKTVCPVHKAGPRLAIRNEGRRKANFELGRILLVEDHEVSRLVISKALNAVGWTVDEVSTAEEGRTLAMKQAYQAILTDLHLGSMSGLDIARAVRGQAAGPNYAAPLLAVSADVNPARKEQCTRLGFDGFIEKPVRPRDLVAMLVDAIVNKPQIVDQQTAARDGSARSAG